MPARRPEDPWYPSDSVEAVLRFAGGLVLGLALSTVLFLLLPLDQWPIILGIGLTVGIACGVMTVWLGKKFWTAVFGLLRGIK